MEKIVLKNVPRTVWMVFVTPMRELVWDVFQDT